MKESELALSEGLGVYADTLKKFEAHIIAGNDVDELDGFLTDGAVAYVFTLDESTVGKIPQSWRFDPYSNLSAEDAADAVDRTIAALRRTQGIPGVEQLKCWSSSEPLAWCTEYIMGQTVDKCTFDEDVLEPQFTHLLDAVEALVEAEIYVDTASGNVIYDPANGFTLIDYALSDEIWQSITLGDPKKALEITVSSLADPSVLFEGYDMRSLGAVPDALVVFRELCLEKYGPSTAQAIDKQWKSFIDYPPWPPQSPQRC